MYPYIRFYLSRSLCTTPAGNFVADVASNIDLEAGLNAYLGTGPLDQTSGSGIKFNKGNGNALLTLNTGSFRADVAGSFVADVASNINLEAGTGGLSGARAYLGTGDKLFNTGSGIAINKGNGNVFLTSQAGSDGPNPGRVFIESGNNGFLTGSCATSTVSQDVCLPLVPEP